MADGRHQKRGVEGFLKNCNPRSKLEEDGTVTEYVEVEYRVRAKMQHPLLKWWVNFPRTGCFPNKNLNDMGK